MMNGIGVVIATFNGEKYIRQQLESIVRQSVTPDFILISDGGSKDRTVEICNDFLSDTKITHKLLTSETQLPVAINFNKALENCECDYIFFSDQDDYWHKDKIKYTLKYMKEKNACMCFTNASITDGKLIRSGKSLWNVIGFTQSKEAIVYHSNNTEFINELIKHNVVTGMTMCITAKLRDVVLPLTEFSIHDKWISVIAAHCGTVVALNKELVLYRQHGNNEVGTEKSIKRSFNNRKKYVKNLEDRIETIEELLVRFEEYNLSSPFDFKLYLSYLKTRLIAVNNMSGIVEIIKQFKRYFKYEYKPIQIIVKDIIVSIGVLQ